MDDNLFDKLVNHRRGQFGKIGIPFCQREELLGTGSIFRKGSKLLFCFGDGRIQRLLFRLIVRQQAVKPLRADPANGVGLIELLDNTVQFVPAFPVFIQFPSGVLCRVLLANL